MAFIGGGGGGGDAIPHISAASRGVWGHADPPESFCILCTLYEMDSNTI